RVLAVSMIADGLVTVFMMILGMALLAWFTVHPDMLATGQTIMGDADQLFPRFIAVGLPAGISGLVIAGLLAAAMSSLSSGINSSSTVITVDFLNRLRSGPQDEHQQIRSARWASVWVGVAVILLSFAVHFVQGNLLEVAFRVVNLFVAPLFFMFLMALFIPNATTAGTLVGTAGSIVIAVGIAYLGWFGLSFLWIMPASLAAGVILGVPASAIFRSRSRI
ncbi:MAG: Na+:solute symporter, partial [Verrucomicrobia bacterium]|nr:Na+:solute symporter [Verrucomicrobiota bacterium]